jgi:pimeloyl-ACP methyl ester carboxylesterase
VDEVRIELPNGSVIAGKWWGSKDIRPFICLHGWQDNAGTFDRLIPLLPKNCSYLAIDFPGNGRSSRLPNGINYHFFDNLYAIHSIAREYKWEKISFIAHSMGAGVAFVFAALFPEIVDMIINIDWLKPWSYKPHKIINEFQTLLEEFPKADQRSQDTKEPQAYSLDELIKKLHSATFGSVSREFAPHLLERQIAPSKKFPGKFYLTKDPRMNYSMGINQGVNVYVEMAKELKMPFMYIKAQKSLYKDYGKSVEDVLKILSQSPKFEHHKIDSECHHLHLVEPEKIAGKISKFIQKYSTKSKL